MRNPPTAMLFRWQHAFSKVQIYAMSVCVNDKEKRHPT